MKWQQIDKYHFKRGIWTITEPGMPELYPKPYGLYCKEKLVGNYASRAEAMQEVEHQEAAQI